MSIDIELQVIREGYDRKTCFVHARAGMVPDMGSPFGVVMTMSELSLEKGKNDLYSSLYEMRSLDGGITWEGPFEHRDTLGRRQVAGGEEVVCDFWPAWHEKTRTLLGTGHDCFYVDNDLPEYIQARSTVYSVYDPRGRTWTKWTKMPKGSPGKFRNEGAGSTQRYDLPDGTILLPSYFMVKQGKYNDINNPGLFSSTVMKCRFDGKTLEYIEHGDEIHIPAGRGFVEPSLAFFKNRFFLTLRNNDDGYVTAGNDGLHFGPVRPWCFDDGETLGNYNTQQHWVTMKDALYLVYTRRGAGNDHIPRHRAPLFIAQVDPDRLCVIRSTEQILVPEHGARLCNFGVTRISDRESWVTVTEWMQTTWPDPWDCTVCEKYGSSNRIFVARIRERF